MKRFLKQPQLPIRFFLALLPLFILSSCEKVKDILSFDIPVEQTYDFEIPAIDTVGSLTIESPAISIDIEKMLKEKNENLSLGNIKEARIASIKLVVKEGSRMENNNLMSLKDIDLEFKSSVMPSWMSLTNGKITPDQPYEYTLPVNSSFDFKDYFKDNTFYFQITASNITKIIQTIPCTIQFKFIVRAGLE
jgi:hypothetical protein